MSENSYEQSQDIRLQIVDSAEGISEFSEHWDKLFARSADVPPYLSRSWICTFVEEGQIRGKPLFILALSGPKLVGLFPLAIYKFLKVKIAIPIGLENASYFGILIDPEFPSVIEYIADLIIAEKIFDVYINTYLSSSDTPANELLSILRGKGCFCQQELKDPCYYIQLDCSFEEYLNKCMSSRSRHTLRRKERRLFRNVDVNIDYYTGMQVTNELMNRIAVIQQESWMKRRGVAILGQPFYQRFFLAMARSGMGCLWLMTVDGEDAAFQYAFLAHKRMFFRSTAFKLKYESLSIGQSLMMQAIRDACSGNYLSINLGPGDAEYKRFWATDNFYINRAIVSRGLMGRLIAKWYCFTWRLVKMEHLHAY